MRGKAQRAVRPVQTRPQNLGVTEPKLSTFLSERPSAVLIVEKHLNIDIFMSTSIIIRIYSLSIDKVIRFTANVVDDTAYRSTSAPPLIPIVADGHEFSAVKRLSRRLLDRSKNAICGALVGSDPIGISSRSLTAEY